MNNSLLGLITSTVLAFTFTGCSSPGGANRLPAVSLHGADRIAKTRPGVNLLAAMESDFTLAGSIEKKAEASGAVEETYIRLLTEALKSRRFKMADSATVRTSNGTILRLGPY